MSRKFRVQKILLVMAARDDKHRRPRPQRPQVQLIFGRTEFSPIIAKNRFWHSRLTVIVFYNVTTDDEKTRLNGMCLSENFAMNCTTSPIIGINAYSQRLSRKQRNGSAKGQQNRPDHLRC